MGIVTDGRAEDARKVIKDESMTWPNVLEGGDKIAEQYHVKSNPSFFVIDRDGKLVVSSRDLQASFDSTAVTSRAYFKEVAAGWHVDRKYLSESSGSGWLVLRNERRKPRYVIPELNVY